MKQIRTIANRLQKDSDTDFFEEVMKKGRKGYHEFKRNPFGFFANQNYTGPMTKFEGQSHLDKLDWISRLHDMDYFFAHHEKDPEKFKKNLLQADKNMVNRIDKLSQSEKIGPYGKFVRSVINAKAKLTEKGILPHDLFVDRKAGSRVHPYTVGRFGNIENPKFKYEYKDIYQQHDLKPKKLKFEEEKQEEPSIPKMNPVLEKFLDTPSKVPPKNITYSQINNDMMDSLNEHSANIKDQLQQLSPALQAKNTQDVLKVIQSPNVYTDLLEESMKKINPESPISSTLQTGQHYHDNLTQSLQDVEILRSAHKTGVPVPIGTGIPNPRKTRNKQNINYVLSTKEQKIFHTPPKFRP